MSIILPVMTPARQAWLDQVFSSRAAATGGVVRRKTSDVARNVGADRLELEVRRRGFHMIEIGGQTVIFCNRGESRVIC